MKKRHTLYNIWAGMKARCYNSKNPKFKNYGGRGVSVCNEWHKSSSFISWAINGWQPGLSLDRINNDGNYSPDNCRWATNIEQCNNMRKNIFIEYKGKRQTISQWSKELGIKKETLLYRFKNWPADKVFEYNKNYGHLREKRYCPYEQHRKAGINIR